MKRLLLTALLAIVTLGNQAHASSFSVNVGQPGFYGRIDIGGFPRPPVIYPQPVMIQHGPPGMAPYYLRVPPGHAKQWHKHCHSYRACGRPVYFVRDDWYRNDYSPRYREQRDYHDLDRRYRGDNRHDGRRYDRRGDDRHDRGNDRSRGRGNGRDRDD